MQPTHAAAAALLAKHLEENFAAIVEQGVRRSGMLPGYAAVAPEQLRPRVAIGFRAVLHDLKHPTDSEFERIFGALSEQRARQRFAIRDVCAVIQLTEQILVELAASQIEPLDVRLAAVEAIHAVCVSAREAIIDSFWKVNQELLTRSEALVRQLSSPLLPIADGVIVLPLIGAVDEPRARQIMESLLQGIVSHRAALAIIDVTAVTDFDGYAWTQLIKAAQAGRLLGAQIVFVGTSVEAAQSIAQQSADQSSMEGLITLSDLQAGLAYALAQRSKRTAPPKPTPGKRSS
jgi:anti-anti-sigma regulatory factor